MISSFFYGIGRVFSMQPMPRSTTRQTLGKHIFQKILDSATRKATSAEKSLLAQGSVPFTIIEEWFMGETGDPLSILFALFLERFSSRRKYRLPHTTAVEIPMETAGFELSASKLDQDRSRSIPPLCILVPLYEFPERSRAAGRYHD